MTEEQPAPRASGVMDAVALVLTAAELAVAAYVWRYGPEGRIPMHFGLDGHVDRWGGRGEAAAMIAAMGVLSGGLYVLLPALSRRRADGDASGRALAYARVLLLIVPALVSGLFVYLAFGHVAEAGSALPARAVMGLLALVLLVTGALVGKTGPNPFVGVRTYWALRSRLAWDKSNRLMGRLMFWIGLSGLVAAPLAPQPLGLSVFLGLSAVAALWPIYESWRVWKHDPERSVRA